MEGQRPSLLDNIFTNNSRDEICSGNIHLTLSEHFSQFASVNRKKLILKKLLLPLNLVERKLFIQGTDFYQKIVSLPMPCQKQRLHLLALLKVQLKVWAIK